MSRLRRYFEDAATTRPQERRLGLEIETLFVDGDGAPLGPTDARAIYETLGDRGWSASDEPDSNPWLLRRGAFRILPEVGAGNIEIITPPRPIDDLDTLVGEARTLLHDLYDAADDIGARPLARHYDGARDVDNLLVPDPRDEKWVQVDGRDALKYLGHIASVHATVDLASIDEAFDWIPRLDEFFRRRNWPPPETREIWSDYLRDSRVDYDPERAGAGPTPTTFETYLERLRSFSVVMNTDDSGGLRRLTPSPPRLADIEETADLPLFVGTIWFQTRLRVIDDHLALEIRVVPRRDDDAIAPDVHDLLATLGF